MPQPQTFSNMTQMMLGWLVCAGLGVFLWELCLCVRVCWGISVLAGDSLCVCICWFTVCTVYCSTWFIDSVCKPVFLYFFSRLPTFIWPSFHLAHCLSLSRHRGLQRAVTPQKRRTWKVAKVHYQLLMNSAYRSLGSAEWAVCILVQIWLKKAISQCIKGPVYTWYFDLSVILWLHTKVLDASPKTMLRIFESIWDYMKRHKQLRLSKSI